MTNTAARRRRALVSSDDTTLDLAKLWSGGTSANRVQIRRVQRSDEELFRRALSRGISHLAPWSVISSASDAFAEMLRMDVTGAAMYFLALDAADGECVGRVSIYNVIRGSFQSATIGYTGYKPYVGTGRMTEAVQLVVDHCFSAAPVGLGLHRIEANIMPGNLRSTSLAERVGFRLEGRSPRFQFVNGRWRDHLRFALTAEEWISSNGRRLMRSIPQGPG